MADDDDGNVTQEQLALHVMCVDSVPMWLWHLLLTHNDSQPRSSLYVVNGSNRLMLSHSDLLFVTHSHGSFSNASEQLTPQCARQQHQQLLVSRNTDQRAKAMCFCYVYEAANKPSKQTTIYLWTARQTLRLGRPLCPINREFHAPTVFKQSNCHSVETAGVFMRSKYDKNLSSAHS